MQTRTVSWLFHGERGKKMHRLWVPERKVPAHLLIDAINWEAPIADELSNTDIDYADSIRLKIAGSGVNCLEPTKTPGTQAIYRKSETPDAWVYQTDRSNESAERYREEQKWTKTIEMVYWQSAMDWDRKQEQQRCEDLYAKLTEKQRTQQVERNRLMAIEEARDEEERKNRHDYPRPPSSLRSTVRDPSESRYVADLIAAAGRAWTDRRAAERVEQALIEHERESAIIFEKRIIGFSDGLLSGLLLEHEFPRPLYAIVNDLRVGYRVSGYVEDDLPIYTSIPSVEFRAHCSFCDRFRVHGHWLKIENLEQVRQRISEDQ